MRGALRGSRLSLIAGGLLVGLLLLVAAFADEITAVSPHYWDAKSSIREGLPPFPPGPGHPLGTDQFGRDIWSRVVYGTRWSLLFAALVTGARVLIALVAAFASVYGPRRAGWLVDKLYVMTSAIPPLVTYLLLLSTPAMRTIGLWPNVAITVCVLTLVEWPRVAVVLKGRIDQLMAEPFLQGAVAVGGGRWHIFRTHLMPHLWPTFLHLVAAEMARALLLMAQMGIFGILFGGGITVVVDNGRGGDRWIQTTGLPEWGSLLSDGRPYILSCPWIPLPPAVAFLIAVTGFTMLSQGLEGINLSVTRLKERTTGQFSPRWRWALVALPLLGALLFSQGLPWEREAGTQPPENLETLRGYHVDVTAAFDPLDPSVAAMMPRRQVYYLATAADHAYSQVMALFPEAIPHERPSIRLYETHDAFRQAVGGAAPPDALAWYTPGGPLRLSPQYLQGFVRWQTERTLGYEFVKYLSATAYAQPNIDPVAMGLYELSTAGDRTYRIDPYKLVGATLPDLIALFTTPVQSLGAVDQWAYAAAAAELVRFLQERLPAAELQGPTPGERWSLETLAERLREPPEALSAEYETFLQQELRATSVLAAPGAMSWVPEGLPEAIAMRAEAAAGGDDAGFLRRTAAETRSGWSSWLAAARQSGLVRYDAMLLNWDRNSGTALVLERLQFGDGRIVSGVVQQTWAQEDGLWAAGSVESAWRE